MGKTQCMGCQIASYRAGGGEGCKIISFCLLSLLLFEQKIDLLYPVCGIFTDSALLAGSVIKSVCVCPCHSGTATLGVVQTSG